MSAADDVLGDVGVGRFLGKECTSFSGTFAMRTFTLPSGAGEVQLPVMPEDWLPSPRYLRERWFLPGVQQGDYRYVVTRESMYPYFFANTHVAGAVAVLGRPSHAACRALVFTNSNNGFRALRADLAAARDVGGARGIATSSAYCIAVNALQVVGDADPGVEQQTKTALLKMLIDFFYPQAPKGTVHVDVADRSLTYQAVTVREGVVASRRAGDPRLRVGVVPTSSPRARPVAVVLSALRFYVETLPVARQERRRGVIDNARGFFFRPSGDGASPVGQGQRFGGHREQSQNMLDAVIAAAELARRGIEIEAEERLTSMRKGMGVLTEKVASLEKQVAREEARADEAMVLLDEAQLCVVCKNAVANTACVHVDEAAADHPNFCTTCANALSSICAPCPLCKETVLRYRPIGDSARAGAAPQQQAHMPPLTDIPDGGDDTDGASTDVHEDVWAAQGQELYGTMARSMFFYDVDNFPIDLS